MRRMLPTSLIPALLALMAGAAPAAPLRVTVAIAPQAWFVERIAGDDAVVSVLLAPGASPATYEPTPRQVSALEDADLFLCSGVPFEQGLRPRIEAMPAGPRCVGPRPAAEHRHDHGHDHGALDPHGWLSPAGARALADTVTAALCSLLPTRAAAFAAARAELEATIDAAAAGADSLLSGHRGDTFVVFHPSFGHFAAAYGLVQVAIEQDGHEPGARRLAEVSDLARRRRVGAVIVQPQFSQRAAAAVAASIGVPLVELDPLAPDWDTNHLHIARTLAEVAGREAARP